MEGIKNEIAAALKYISTASVLQVSRTFDINFLIKMT